MKGLSSRMDSLAIATEALAAFDQGRQIPPFSQRCEGFDLDAAYRAAAHVRALRAARGELPVGRKIGFTNRTMWSEYGVWTPIWGHVYDTSVRDLPPGEPFRLGKLPEPRIEPEIVFQLAKPPARGMQDAELLECIQWVAHGFEIVQSIFPGWKFAAADTVAGLGLHGALLIGPRHAIGSRRDEWLTALRRFQIELYCDGEAVDRGQAANVLEGPLSALRHLVEVLERDSAQPPLAAGEIVTTGTLTRAFPVAPGQTWSTALHGIAIEGISVALG